jgi:hypothetical protein
MLVAKNQAKENRAVGTNFLAYLRHANFLTFFPIRPFAPTVHIGNITMLVVINFYGF